MADTVVASSRSMLTARLVGLAWRREAVAGEASEPFPGFGGSVTADLGRPRSVPH